jgi:hypothetical protein
VDSKGLAKAYFVSADSTGIESACFDTLALDFVSADSKELTRPESTRV